MAKELITESSVRSMPSGGVLRLGSGVIATPAALDLAHERGIRVEWGQAPLPGG